MKLFKGALQVIDPRVITPIETKGKPDWLNETKRGKFRKVLSLTGKEWVAVRMMEMNQERFAPEHGDGILISEEAFQQFQH